MRMVAGTAGVGEEHRRGQNVIDTIGETVRIDAVEAGTLRAPSKRRRPRGCLRSPEYDLDGPFVGLCCFGSAIVSSAARHDGRDNDQACVLVETDERSPVPDTEAPLVSSAFKASHVSGGQPSDCREEALLFVARELAQCLRRCRRDHRVPRG